MAENEAEEGDPNVDEDGIQIQSYTAMVLVVVPPKDFGTGCKATNTKASRPT